MKTIGLVAGPCSAESRTQMLETARGLKEMGVGILRAGLWKPRSRCGTFEGVGEEGLDWMREIQQELGLRVVSEVALPCHVEAVRGADLDWCAYYGQSFYDARTGRSPVRVRYAGMGEESCMSRRRLMDWCGRTPSTGRTERHPHYSSWLLHGR